MAATLAAAPKVASSEVKRSTSPATTSTRSTGGSSDVFRPTFEIIEGKGKTIRVICTTENFDEYRDWMPFIDFDGTFEESYPMKAEFRAARTCAQDIIDTLVKHGYHQRNARLWAKM